jgi:hypothetical protein
VAPAAHDDDAAPAAGELLDDLQVPGGLLAVQFQDDQGRVQPDVELRQEGGRPRGPHDAVPGQLHEAGQRPTDTDVTHRDQHVHDGPLAAGGPHRTTGRPPRHRRNVPRSGATFV